MDKPRTYEAINSVSFMVINSGSIVISSRHSIISAMPLLFKNQILQGHYNPLKT